MQQKNRFFEPLYVFFPLTEKLLNLQKKESD